MAGSFATEADANRAGDLMQNCIKDIADPQLPFLVDVECGNSWGDSMG
jgi:hypothetical protein